jgi:hypothetical protein
MGIAVRPCLGLEASMTEIQTWRVSIQLISASEWSINFY